MDLKILQFIFKLNVLFSLNSSKPMLTGSSRHLIFKDVNTILAV